MKITETALEGVRILEPKYFEDARGYYSETYSARTLKSVAGIEDVFVQEGHSLSRKKGTLRGIHFQLNPHAQIKLVRCIKGRILDVAVDLRKGSRTFAKWVGVELSEENRRQLWIPVGFGHAFLTLEDDCQVQYKVSEFYYPEHDRSIRWNDPAIGVDWNISEPVLSDKDAKAPFLGESDVNFTLE